MAWKRIALSLCATAGLGACDQLDRVTSSSVCASDESKRTIESLITQSDGGMFKDKLEKLLENGELQLTDITYGGKDRKADKVLCSASIRIATRSQFVEPETFPISFSRQPTADGRDAIYDLDFGNRSLVDRISARGFSAHFKQQAIEDAKRPPRDNSFTMPRVGEDEQTATPPEAGPVISPDPTAVTPTASEEKPAE